MIYFCLYQPICTYLFVVAASDPYHPYFGSGVKCESGMTWILYDVLISRKPLHTVPQVSGQCLKSCTSSMAHNLKLSTTRDLTHCSWVHHITICILINSTWQSLISICFSFQLNDNYFHVVYAVSVYMSFIVIIVHIY